MKKQVIMFFYTGSHPDENTIKGLGEVLINSGVCDPNSLTNINLDEDSIAKQLAASLIAQGAIPNEDPIKTACKCIAAIISNAKHDPIFGLYDSLRRTYLTNIRANDPTNIVKYTRVMYDSRRRNDCIQYIQDFDKTITYTEAKSSIDVLFEMSRLCLGLIVE